MPNPYVSHIQLGTNIYDIYDESAHEELSSQESNLDSLTENLNNAEAELGQVKTSITELQSSLSTANDNISDLNGKYTTLNGFYNMLNSQLDGLQTRVETAEANIRSAQSSISSINSTLSGGYMSQQIGVSASTHFASVNPDYDKLTVSWQKIGTSSHYMVSIFGYLEATLSNTTEISDATLTATLPASFPAQPNKQLYNFGGYTVGGKAQGDPWITGQSFCDINNSRSMQIHLAQTNNNPATSAVYYRISWTGIF